MTEPSAEALLKVEGELWAPTIVYMCKTPGMSLWSGLQYVRGLKEPFPYEINPECKCKNCKGGEWVQKK